MKRLLLIIILTANLLFAQTINISADDITIRNERAGLVNADLYVSPEGDNENSGLTPDDPLKNIWYALSIITTDSLNPHTIHLLEGHYSPGLTGETDFSLTDYVSVSGASQTSVILDSIGIGLHGEENSLSNLTMNRGIDCDATNATLENLTVSANSDFAGISCITTNVTLENVTVSNISSIVGALYLNNSSFTINNSEITNNTTSLAAGGGVNICNSGGELHNVVISNNSSRHNGGGVYCDNSSPVFYNTQIIGNTVDSVDYAYGGGLYCYNSNPVFYNSQISNNAVNGNIESFGGGVYCENSTPLFYNTIFSGNMALSEGSSVIYCEGDSHPVLYNATITGNQQGNFWLHQVYLIANKDTNSNVSIINSIVYFNDTTTVGSATWMYGVTATYSDIQKFNGIWPGEGNIDQDPVFVNSGEHPYQINDLSPCIDMGNPDTTGLNLPEYDPAGEVRISNNIVDMGAYEWNIMVGTDEPVFSDFPKNNLSIYPNPACKTLHITFQSESTAPVIATIYNQLGQQIKSEIPIERQPGNNELSLDVSSLETGVYLLQLAIDGQVTTKKFVKY